MLGIINSFTSALILSLIAHLVILGIIYSLTILIKYSGGRGVFRKTYVYFLEYSLIIASLLLPITAYFINPFLAKPAIYYFLLAYIIAGIIIYSVTSSDRKYLIIYFSLTIIMFTSILPVFVKNYFYPEYEYYTQPLFIDKNIHSYQEEAVRGGFYYFIPIDPLLWVSYGIIADYRSSLFPIRDTVFLFITIYLLLFTYRRLGLKTVIPGLLLIFGIPQLSFIVSRILPIPYISLLLFMVSIGLMYRGHNISYYIVFLLASLIMIFSHPIGPLTIIGLFVIFVVLEKFFRRIIDKSNGSENNNMSYLSHYLSSTTLIVIILTVAYWFSTYLYILLVSKARDLLDATITFTNMFFGTTRGELAGRGLSYILAPGYSKSSFWIFAYSWSLPIALIVIGFTIIPTYIIIKKKHYLWHNLLLSASISSLAFLLLAYTAYTIGYEAGQYSLPTSYLLAFIGSVIVIDRFLERIDHRRALLIVFSILLASVITLGNYAPDWSPLEHTNFEVEATIHPYINYILAKKLKPLFIPMPRSYIYSDYDLKIGLKGQYKNVRLVLYEIISGNKKLLDYPNSFFIFRKDRLVYESIALELKNNYLVYNSPTHIILYSQI